MNNAMRQHPVKPWSNRIADAKWKYVHRLKKMNYDKWPVLACRWRPDMVIDLDYIAQPKRKQGHPLLRWDDAINDFCEFTFATTCQDAPRDDRLEHLSDYNEYCNNFS